MKIMTFVLACSMAAGVAHAQPAAPAAPASTAQLDARFSNWLGCWRLEDDLAGTGARLCITPDGPGVRLQTIAGKVRSSDEALRADGTTRPITDTDCKGTERAEWSSDGQRVFRYTDVACGSEALRKVKGVAFLTSGPSWINVQFVEGGPASSVRVQRYRRAADQTLADGTRAAQPPANAASPMSTAQDASWSVDDVIEASGKIPSEALQAALAESKGPFRINKDTLTALGKAGVDEPVIDLMIGLTFPERFVVERRNGSGGGLGSMPLGISMGGGYYDPFLSQSGMYADCYAPYGYGYRSLYSSCGMSSLYGYYPYGYGYGYGGYYPGYYPGGGLIGGGSAPTTPPVTSSGSGRVVNGRGYTQVRPRDPEPASARSRGDGGNGSSAGWSGNNGGASSGTSGVSSQGYGGGSSSGSGSSSGDSGGRTAVPRPPGGGK
jgi:hypothetical protein